MIKIFYLILLFVITYETIPGTLLHPPSSTTYIYLPMKKDHKFGDDICYYREYDEKLLYYIYYVRPCEKGKYCQNEVSDGQPFGYCVDIQTKTTTISNLDESCESDYECHESLNCENSKCRISCQNQIYQHDLDSFDCHDNNYKQLETNQCEFNEYTKDVDNFYMGSIDHTYEGKYPGLPKKCGKKNYKPYDYPYNNPSTGAIEKDTKYRVESKEWCTIGSVPDNEFVDDAVYCNSGFTLNFYPNKQLTKPSKGDINSKDKMCVTPIEIDLKNPDVDDGCIITYKIGDQSPKKYKASASSGLCSQDIIIKSERHRAFADAFNSASDEDKQNCYDITTYIYRCKNVNLIKLWYFKTKPEDYLFYKDRKKLEKVLDYKIQKIYPTYSEFSHYLNYSYFLFLLILIIM